MVFWGWPNEHSTQHHPCVHRPRRVSAVLTAFGTEGQQHTDAISVSSASTNRAPCDIAPMLATDDSVWALFLKMAPCRNWISQVNCVRMGHLLISTADGFLKGHHRVSCGIRPALCCFTLKRALWTPSNFLPQPTVRRGRKKVLGGSP